jgi:hypothetical protein
MIATRSALGPDRALLGAAALLAALTVWPFLPAAEPPPVESAAASPPPALAPLPPLSRFAAVVERPLFTPSRRPLAAESVDLGSGGLDARYRLLGVTIAGDRGRALLAEGGRRFEIGVGDSLAGWTVARIEQSRVVLESPTGEAALTLKRAAEPPAKPPAR